ncbi:hypothetical protein AWZ03_014666 [Drosophila navojoa]|uniref:Uncharacterized protein n=1 Tax=Drosophila navojoa TaxID=7232 RepID=A0A484AS60_DRONA|nr:hypothetical protein AWZ03_014666 [Drosophila navojoa]
MFSLGLVANGLGIWFTAMRNRSNMRLDSKADMTFCKILFSTRPNDIEDSEPDLIVACNDGLLGGALLEFVPTYLRAKALCISLMWCRWGAVVGTTIVGIYVEKSCEMTILVIAIFPMLSASIEGFLPL